MTYREIAPWPPLEDFMLMSLRKRVEFVRKNLTTAGPRRRSKHLTLDEFAAAVGAKDRHRPIGWEKGQKPRDYAEKIAAFTPYPAAALGGDGGDDLFEDTVGGLLRSLVSQVADLARGQTGIAKDVAALQERVGRLEARPLPDQVPPTGQAGDR